MEYIGDFLLSEITVFSDVANSLIVFHTVYLLWKICFGDKTNYLQGFAVLSEIYIIHNKKYNKFYKNY